MEQQGITQNLESSIDKEIEEHLSPGVVLSNRYSIKSIIGIGGMGAVYCARDMHFHNIEKQVAVKEMVNPMRDPVMREAIVRNFEREANILATLSHPAIPRIYDYFTFNERSYLILEYIEGKDLEALLNDTQGFFPESVVINWALELCDVLHYLHNHKPNPIIFHDMVMQVDHHVGGFHVAEDDGIGLVIVQVV